MGKGERGGLCGLSGQMSYVHSVHPIPTLSFFLQFCLQWLQREDRVGWKYLLAVLVTGVLLAMIFILMVPTFYRPAITRLEVEEPGKFDSWREFTSAIGRFKVMLPTQPLHATESLPIQGQEYKLSYQMYAAEDMQGTTYSVNMITYPDEINLNNPRSVLENVMNELAGTNKEGELETMAFGTFAGVESLDFIIHTPQTIVSSRTFLVGQRLFLLTMIAKTHLHNSDNYIYFADSFEFVE